MYVLGFCFGMYGSEVVFWKNFMLGLIFCRVGILDDLRYFNVLKDGWLISKLFVIYVIIMLVDCVIYCIYVGKKCFLFDYVYFIEFCEF